MDWEDYYADPDNRVFLLWLMKQGIVQTENRLIDDQAVQVVQIPALAYSSRDLRVCPNPIKSGYDLHKWTINDWAKFVLDWVGDASRAGMIRCYVCDQLIASDKADSWQLVLCNGTTVFWLPIHLGKCIQTFKEMTESSSINDIVI